MNGTEWKDEEVLTPARLAWALGGAGLLPFLIALGVILLAPTAWQVSGVYAFLFYSAVILSFLGGTHWGAEVQNAGQRPEGARRLRLVVAMLPSLVAWPALLMSPPTAVWVLMAGFIGIWGFDLLQPGRSEWPRWHLYLRTWLTLVVVATHLGAGIYLTGPGWP